MKQFMYDDRQYLPVPNVGGLGVGGNPPNLVERLMLGNLRRKNPYDLWFIDRRTRDRHSGVVDQLAGQLASDSKGDRRPGWSFYLPTRDCPADYRELSILFMLHSIHKDPRRRSRKGRPTVHGNSVANSFHGLEKLTGVGKGQACVLAKRLEDLNLIKVVPTEGWPWFHLADPAPFADWFMPVSSKSSGGVPPEIMALEQECQQAQEARAQRQAEDARAQEAEILKSAVERALAYGQPEQALAMCDQRIPFEILQHHCSPRGCARRPGRG
jgi:hypothetical protein